MNFSDDQEIINILEQHIENLKEKKPNYFCGLCPIHGEKTPSLYIDLNRNIFKCFGCGIGGSINNLLRLVGNTKYNYQFKNSKTESTINYNSNWEYNNELRHTILKLILEHSKKEILHNKLCIEFLYNRGMDIEHIVKSEIGFTSSSLISYLTQNGISTDQMKEFAFFKINEKGLIYFALHHKLLFPIYHNGKIISFAGRNLDDKIYINLLNDDYYQKSEVFYYSNFFYKKNIQNQYLYLVEGYFDSIALYKQNKLNLACMGSSLSEKQIDFIKTNHFYNKIVSCFDLDNPGFGLALKLSKHISIDLYASFKSKDIDEAINKKYTIKLLSRKDFLSKHFNLINHVNFVYLTNQEKIDMFFTLFQQRCHNKLTTLESENITLLCILSLRYEKELLRLAKIYPLSFEEYKKLGIIQNSFLLKKFLPRHINKHHDTNHIKYKDFIRMSRSLIVYQKKIQLFSLEDIMEYDDNINKYFEIKKWLFQNENLYLSYDINSKK